MSAKEDTWLSDFLREESTEKYFIEYEGFKPNHMAHGIVALHNLGASKSRISQFIKWYSQHMEPPDHPNHRGENPSDSPVNETRIQKLLGTRTTFYGIRNYFEGKLKQCSSLATFVQKEFPNVSDGMCFGGYHGLIQLGYGFHAKSEKVVCEGLAYLHHSYEPVSFDSSDDENNISNFGRGNKSLLDTLSEIKDDSTLKGKMLDGALERKKKRPDLHIFFHRMSALMKIGDKILRYANKIEIPLIKTGGAGTDVDSAVKVSDWLLQQAIAVYVLSERPNDFFLLHGVTGCWSLKQIVSVLKPSDAMEAMRTFLCGLLVIYITQDSPAMLPPANKKGENFNDGTWKDIIDKTLASDFDEHVFKLVQVCHDFWCENKGDDQVNLYVKAAKSCLDNDLAFITYEGLGDLK